MRLFVILLLLLATPVLAYQGPFQPNEPVNFPSNCLNSQKQFINASQNITAYYPNGSIFINNSAMQQIGIGKFQLDFTAPNITGTYLVEKTCIDDGGNIAQGGDSFEVLDFEEAVGMSAVAVLLGFMLLTGGLFYLSYRHNLMSGLQKILAPVLHLLGIWSILLPLLYISNVGLIDPLGDTVMFIGIVFVVIYTLIYLPLSVLLLTSNFIREQASQAQTMFDKRRRNG